MCPLASDGTGSDPGAAAGQRRVAPVAVPLYLAIFFVAVLLPRWIGFPRDGFIPPSVITHSVMLVASLAIILGRGGQNWPAFGLARGSYRFRARTLLWALVTALPTTAALLGSPSGADPAAGGPSPFPETPAQVILFVWIYASVCEEVFARGLLQGLLAPWRHRGLRLFGRWFLSAPVWIAAAVFGMGHLILWPFLGMVTVPICISASVLGLVAGYERERTGTVIAAIVIHALFNIGGSVPTWLIGR